MAQTPAEGDVRHGESDRTLIGDHRQSTSGGNPTNVGDQKNRQRDDRTSDEDAGHGGRRLHTSLDQNRTSLGVDRVHRPGHHGEHDPDSIHDSLVARDELQHEAGTEHERGNPPGGGRRGSTAESANGPRCQRARADGHQRGDRHARAIRGREEKGLVARDPHSPHHRPHTMRQNRS